MKARVIYLAMTVMAMFALSACGNEDFLENPEKFKDNSAEIKSLMVSIEKDIDLSYQNWWNDYESNHECFHSLDELENSPYAPVKDEIPEVDWTKQTLVVAYVYHNYTFSENECNVYGASGKYMVEYRLVPHLSAAYDHKGVAIILDKPDVEKKNVNFKVSIKGHDYE